jgi:hypothetical protein
MCVIICTKWVFITMFAVDELAVTSGFLMSSALKPSTKKTYTCAQQKYLIFCGIYKFEPTPVSEETLLLYVAYLFDLGFKCSSIRVYLSAIRSLHVYSGVEYPTNMVRLQLALKGAATQSAPPIHKLPITFSVLTKMLHAIRGRFDVLLFNSVMTLAFFGCFRASEIVISDNRPYDASTHLSFDDLTILPKEKSMCIYLKKSKTDVLSQGVSVYVGCSGNDVCAYCMMCKYLVYRSTIPNNAPSSALFLDILGNPLKKEYFLSTTRLALSMAGFNPSKFSGHSYRSGAATTAGDRGFTEWELKMMGRWKSTAYNVYLRNPKIVSTFAKRLVSP